MPTPEPTANAAAQNGPDLSRPHLPAGEWRSYVILFKGNKNYLRFWLAGVVSQMGNWFNYIAVFVLLNELVGSGVAVSWFLIAKYLPTAILAPAAGVVADRFSRKAIMIFCDVGRIFVVLGFLLVRDAELVWLVFVLALIQETLWSFYDPARRASVPNVCRPEELHLANALSGATWSVMLAVGAALGGLVTAAWGWQTAIVLDALTFAVSAALLASVVLPHVARKKTGKNTWRDYTGLNDLTAGIRYLAGHRQVAALLMVKSGWAISGGLLVMLAIFGEQVFQVGGQGGGSGVLYSMRGIGAAIGPILAWRLLGESNRDMYRSIGLAFFMGCLSYLAFSLSPTLAWAALFVLLGHIGGSVQWVFSTTLLQKAVEDQYRGRVFATEMALVTMILSISTYLTGAALDHGIDPRRVTMVLALCFLVPGVFWTIHAKRRLREE
ncbi:MFS transporter [Desulfurivibrio alkaliphilus]|uniref:Major facilitator superfamily MFS_1 n=1 Tax=Desulfurivibrio alkaliphilus (strain DSM 19089 / UNIQEM U267 / AHT2) TaxID=589865 RepID=D6Z016_DESAT|nr:MFS transporter [Desulfurivibrio alkaliphilus]ADH85173.1 major facilitator superfamily MFS_1 [Desulfurivibrio alkaliphilus AHT 2]